MAKMVVYRRGQAPVIEEVEGLHGIQKVVGGHIGGHAFGAPDLVIYCHDDGKIIGLPPVAACPYLGDVIVGNFCVSRSDAEGGDIDVTEQDLETCLRSFVTIA